MWLVHGVDYRKKICNKFGCNNLIDIRDKYCDTHKSEVHEQIKRWRKNYDDKRKKMINIGSFTKSNQWKIVRDYILKRDNYICQECIKDNKITIYVIQSIMSSRLKMILIRHWTRII